ncbi:MAG: hypothetical protein RIQ46_816 [Pseudomonadota bacterium]|jgi:tight adherence protein B
METMVVRFAILLAVFASVFLLSQALLGAVWRKGQAHSAINRRLRLIKAGGDRDEIIARLRKNATDELASLPNFVAAPFRGLQRALFAAAVPFSLLQVVIAMAAAFLGVLVLLMLAANAAGFAWSSGVIMLFVVIAAIAGVVVPFLLIAVRAQRRRKRVEQQFPVALDVFVRALRSGHPIASAIDLLTQEMEDPIGSEFGIVADEASYGADMNDALQAMAERWDNGDMRMFVVSLAVQSETGGNLAEILENLASVIRARAAMYMKVRALSSEGRLTGWMLTVLPLISFVGMMIVNPAFYIEVAGDPVFKWGFAALILLYIIGVYTIRRMIDLKV